MPRQMLRPPFGPDDWTADRIRYERERRGWSTGELARRVTTAGLPLRQQQVWQMESGTPRRKVSIGEAIALAAVFEIPLAELTRPPQGAVSEDLAEIGVAFAQWRRDAGVLFGRLLDIRHRVDALDPREAVPGWPAELPADLSDAAKQADQQLVEIETVIAELRNAITSKEAPWSAVVSFRDVSGSGQPQAYSEPTMIELLRERSQLQLSIGELGNSLLEARASSDPAVMSCALGALLRVAEVLHVDIAAWYPADGDQGDRDGAR